jgi:2'-5' RNA ligase
MSAETFEPRTAISILLDEIAPDLAAARYELDPRARVRVPLHITLLFPFVLRRDMSADLLGELQAFFGSRIRPTFELSRVAVFPDVVVYAAPEPDGELKRLTRELGSAYPETPPYGGELGTNDPVPHATIAPLEVADEETVRWRVEPLLPIPCEPSNASLLEVRTGSLARARAASVRRTSLSWELRTSPAVSPFHRRSAWAT